MSNWRDASNAIGIGLSKARRTCSIPTGRIARTVAENSNMRRVGGDMSDESQAQIRHCNGCDEDVLPTDINVLHDGPFTQEHWRCPNCGWIDQRTAKNARGLGADFDIDDLPGPPEHPMCKPQCSWTPVFADGEENDD